MSDTPWRPASTPTRSAPGLADALKDRGPQVHAIGDCTGLGLIRKTVEEGARAARAL